jgi:hypothetical protein
MSRPAARRPLARPKRIAFAHVHGLCTGRGGSGYREAGRGASHPGFRPRRVDLTRHGGGKPAVGVVRKVTLPRENDQNLNNAVRAPIECTSQVWLTLSVLRFLLLLAFPAFATCTDVVSLINFLDNLRADFQQTVGPSAESSKARILGATSRGSPALDTTTHNMAFR